MTVGEIVDCENFTKATGPASLKILQITEPLATMPEENRGTPERRPTEAGRPSTWGQTGMAMMIPSLMVAGPLVGYAVGYLIRRGTGWGRWVEILMALMGLAAGIRESILIIRKISK